MCFYQDVVDSNTVKYHEIQAWALKGLGDLYFFGGFGIERSLIKAEEYYLRILDRHSGFYNDSNVQAWIWLRLGDIYFLGHQDDRKRIEGPLLREGN